MNDEETKQNEKPEKKGLKKGHIVAIVVAVIGALGVIIAAYLAREKTVGVNVYIKDATTDKNIPGVIFIDGDSNPTRIDPATGTTVPLKQGKYVIRAESEGYHPNVMVIDRVSSPLNIPMEQIAVITSGPIHMSFAGGRPWSDEITLRAGENTNEIIISGSMVDAAGFALSGLPSAMRGRTLVLYFSNTRASRFSQNRMIKLEYNRNDILIRSANTNMANREYLVNGDTLPDNGVEYPIPDDFDGRLNFTFYQAELHDFKITAYYR